MFFTQWNMLFRTWYQANFFLYEYCKHVLSQYFLNHSFHIILNNDTRNLQPNRPLNLASLTTQFSKLGPIGKIVLVTLFIFFENTCKWKSIWKYVLCCLKIENMCLNICTKRAYIPWLKSQNAIPYLLSYAPFACYNENPITKHFTKHIKS